MQKKKNKENPALKHERMKIKKKNSIKMSKKEIEKETIKCQSGIIKKTFALNCERRKKKQKNSIKMWKKKNEEKKQH